MQKNKLLRTTTLRNAALAAVLLISVHLLYTVIYPRFWRAGITRRPNPDQLPPIAHTPPPAASDFLMTAVDDKLAPALVTGPPVYEPTAKIAEDSAPPAEERPRAALVVLARNYELSNMRVTMRNLEDRFNRKHQYDWVFLNNEEWTEEFKEMTSSLTNAKTKYGVIPKEHWSYPAWVNETKADEARAHMAAEGVIYGESLSYRHMCRFNSGFFYRHELLKDYEFYWRVEPGVRFFCDVVDDPFVFLKRTGKKYGFTISLLEYSKTIPTLWETTKEFIKMHPEYIAEDNSLDFISNDGGKSYNLCHFWSNFEIASLDFWRSKPYMDYFEHLDKKGGFFYERWGDAPVHSIGAALLLKKDDIHFFNDIGYMHNPFHHCPEDKELQRRCVCDVSKNFDNRPYSCTPKWKKMMGLQ